IDLAIESRLVNGKPNPIFPLIVNILSVISEQEKLNISERTRQGILLAQLQGKFAGRKKGTTESDEEFLNKYKNEIKLIKQHSDLSLAKLSRLTGIKSAMTVRKIKMLLEEK